MRNLILMLIAVLVMPVATLAQNKQNAEEQKEEEKGNSVIYYTVKATNIKRDSTSEMKHYGEGGFVKIDSENRVLNLSGEEKYFIKKAIKEEDNEFAWTGELMKEGLEVIITLKIKDEHTFITIFTPKSGHQITMKATEVSG